MTDEKRKRLKAEIDVLQTHKKLSIGGQDRSFTEFMEFVVGQLDLIKLNSERNAHRNIDKIIQDLLWGEEAVSAIHQNGEDDILEKQIITLIALPRVIGRARTLFANAKGDINMQERLTDAAGEMRMLLAKVPGIGKGRY